jgi:hypothetical protein
MTGQLEGASAIAVAGDFTNRKPHVEVGFGSTAVTPPTALTRESLAPRLFPVESETGGAVEFNAGIAAATVVIDPVISTTQSGVGWEIIRPNESGGLRTSVTVAVVQNRADIDRLAAYFLTLIDGRLKELRRENTDEAADLIADYEDLRERIEAFLNRASQFAAKKADGNSLVTATTSFVQGVNNWWSKRHVRICEQAYDRGLTFVDTVIFGIGVDISLHAGASGALAIAIPGAIAGGNRVVQVVKAVMGTGKDKSD